MGLETLTNENLNSIDRWYYRLQHKPLLWPPHKPLLWPHTNCSSGTTQTTPLTLPLISKHMTTEAVGISDWLNSGDHGL
jgi:hypothetical protein